MTACPDPIFKVTVERIANLPLASLRALVAESERSGRRFVGRLTVEWASGINRFAQPGEALFAARVEGQVVGVGGLNVDPYSPEGRVGRVRHLYVMKAYRRHAIGRRLVAEVVAAARRSFDRLRLRTANPEAARFYEALGFAPRAGEADCTHALDLRVRP
jgi:GNAT superfamily N-acetyltransferase